MIVRREEEINMVPTLDEYHFSLAMRGTPNTEVGISYFSKLFMNRCIERFHQKVW